MPEMNNVKAERNTEGGVGVETCIGELIKKIPKLPPYASSLAAKLMDEKANMTEVSEMIKSDPSITGLTLKVVNSPYYGFPMKITNINQAVMLVGTKQIYRIVMDNALRSFFPPSYPEFEHLQKHSYLVSILAEETADAAGRLQMAGLVSTLGLLHDIGRSAVMLLKRKDPQLTEKLDGVDHAKLGGQLLAFWGLPEQIHAPISRYADLILLSPDDLPDKVGDDVAILHIAHICASLVLDDAEGKRDDAFFNLCMDSLDADGMSADRFLKEKLSPRLSSRSRQFPQNIKAVLKNLLSGALAW